MPSASSGDTTSYSTGRVDRQGVDVEGGRALEAEGRPALPVGAEGVAGGISMNVANASLSQMPFHHFIVTRSPNHMWASSWATTSATRWSSCWVAVVGSTSRAVSRNVMQPEVLHGAEGEVGHGDEVDLVAGVGDAVVAPGSTGGRRRRSRGRSRPGRPLPGTCTTRSGVPSTSTGAGGLERSDDERHEVRRHRHGVGEADPRPAVAGRLALDFGTVGDGGQAVVDDEGDAEDGLEVGLVPAGERPAAVGGLELGRRDHVLDRRRRRCTSSGRSRGACR